VVVATMLVATGAAIAFSLNQESLYRSSAQVLLKYQELASGLTGIQNLSGFNQDPARIAQTQSRVAMSPAVARRVIEQAKIPGLDPDEFLNLSTVTASANADILDFSTVYGDAAKAELLATLHAEQYIAHRRELDNAALVAAQRELTARITQLRRGGSADSPLLSKLVEDNQRLRTLEALQTGNASLLRAATSAEKVQPQPVKAAVLGAVLGLLLGIGLAYARNALDTRGERRRNRRAARHPAACSCLGSAEEAPQVESARDARRPARPERGVLPDSSHKPRLREHGPGCALGDDFERPRAGGQIDGCRQPGRRARTFRAPSRAGRSRSPPPFDRAPVRNRQLAPLSVERRARAVHACRSARRRLSRHGGGLEQQRRQRLP
jgi:capsular polysaccharide biosynthesis protein